MSGASVSSHRILNSFEKEKSTLIHVSLRCSPHAGQTDSAHFNVTTDRPADAKRDDQNVDGDVANGVSERRFDGDEHLDDDANRH